MADKKNNALAELANEIERFASENKDLFASRNHLVLYKAQRIVAELAKVEKPLDLQTVGMTHLADILEADKNRAVEIVRNCRAIAEEGAKYGNDC